MATEAKQGVDAEREPNFLLARFERRFLPCAAGRLPRGADPEGGQHPERGLDHIVDALATAAIGLGLGLSPFMLLSIGALIVVGYLILSINVYLESMAFGRFRLGYGLLGPTEIRVVLILINTAMALGLGLDFRLLELNLTVFDVIGLGIVAVMLALLTVRVFGNLRELARDEPAASRH